MTQKRNSFTNEFKLEAVKYLSDHPEMTVKQCAETLGVGLSTLERWKRELKDSELPSSAIRGSSEEEKDILKENARLQRELRDSQEALKILKKAISILGN